MKEMLLAAQYDPEGVSAGFHPAKMIPGGSQAGASRCWVKYDGFREIDCKVFRISQVIFG